MSIVSHLYSLSSIGNNLENNLTETLMMGLEPEDMQGEGGCFVIIYTCKHQWHFFVTLKRLLLLLILI